MFYMGNKLPKKLFVTAAVPDKLKEEYAEMCREKGYKESEYTRHMVRRDVSQWKQEKAA